MPSQTCWFDHLYKTTTHLRQPMLSPPKPIHMQSLLYKTTIFLTWPVTTFLSPKWKKNLSKTTTVKFYSMQKWEGMQKKRMSLWLYLLYCYSNAKFIVFYLCGEGIGFSMQGQGLKSFGCLLYQGYFSLSTCWSWLNEYQELLEI